MSYIALDGSTKLLRPVMWSARLYDARARQPHNSQRDSRRILELMAK